VFLIARTKKGGGKWWESVVRSGNKSVGRGLSPI